MNGLKYQPAPQAAEQGPANSSVTMEELKRLATPLVNWIRENHGYHTEVHISADYVCVKHDGLGIPYSLSEK